MINRKKMLLYCAVAASLTGTIGCSKKKDYDISTEVIKLETEVTTTENYTEQVTEVTTEYNNEIPFDNFESDRLQIEKYISEENFELAKEKGKEFFIKAVDFIFYGTEINGVTWNEINEDAKWQTYQNFCMADRLIENYVPNYKENLSEKYNKVKNFTSEKYYKGLDKIKEAIGEENYYKIGETKDNIKEEVKDKSNKAKVKIKDWYEDFRE